MNFKCGSGYYGNFWAKVKKTQKCWIWAGALESHAGNKVFRYGKAYMNGKMQPAHRVSWTISNGPIPIGMKVLHRCDTPHCVRPDHLFIGTHMDNMRDMIAKGRGGWQKRPTL